MTPMTPKSDATSTMYDSMSQQTPPYRRGEPWIFASVTSLVLLCGVIMLLPKQLWADAQAWMSRYITGSAYIRLKDQSLHGNVVAHHVRMREPGFLVLILDDSYHSPGDNISAYSPYLPAGEYKNVPLNFSLVDTQANVDPRIWAPGQKAYIAVYTDNGDGIEDTTMDHVVFSPQGEPIVDSFTILP